MGVGKVVDDESNIGVTSVAVGLVPKIEWGNLKSAGTAYVNYIVLVSFV